LYATDINSDENELQMDENQYLNHPKTDEDLDCTITLSEFIKCYLFTKYIEYCGLDGRPAYIYIYKGGGIDRGITLINIISKHYS